MAVLEGMQESMMSSAKKEAELEGIFIEMLSNALLRK